MTRQEDRIANLQKQYNCSPQTLIIAHGKELSSSDKVLILRKLGVTHKHHAIFSKEALEITKRESLAVEREFMKARIDILKILAGE